ncbi:hypothetical protein FB567DRAFT_99349 [Paraphoma chrysanthemicola]|uniref:Uncharacterized protein n=1 Tax=Paraphoma chrysanthemicola TaxID=798071 RepID=A0A8K0R2H2_9PLEO|nr:hypothetical protein FB567DRAFT_99349 [Paraphoma chrysanthemicola]
MSNFSTNCLSYFTGAGDYPLINEVRPCQDAANTSFCWPPNGTRICVPTIWDLAIYWPPAYYAPDVRVGIDYERSRLLHLMNNTGKSAVSITEYLFDGHADSIPGQPINERRLKIYMREGVPNDDVPPWNLTRHEGPTITLVQTAQWTRTSSAWPTATRRPSRSGSDSGSRLSGGQIAGIVIASIGALIFLVTCTCYNCCCGVRGPPKQNIDPEEQARVVAQGVELMEQGKRVQPQVQHATPTLDVGNRATDLEIERIREERAPAYTEEPPPKYTP